MIVFPKGICRQASPPFFFQKTDRRFSRGFTLVEMLATIAILAILVALLFPPLNAMRLSSEESRCAGNMRSISAALMAYAADNNMTLPPIAAGNSTDQRDFWSYKIWTYAGYSVDSFKNPDNDFRRYNSTWAMDRNIFHCPTVHRLGIKTPTPPATSVAGTIYSYGLNSTPAMVQTGTNSPLVVNDFILSLPSIEQPSKTAMLIECSNNQNFANAYRYHENGGLIPHKGGSNFAFFDGSVRKIRYEDVPPYVLPIPTQDIFWTGRSSQ